MEQSHCRTSVGRTRVTDLVFDYDAVILAVAEGFGVGSRGTAPAGEALGT